MPIAITDERRALQESIRDWAGDRGVGAVRDLETTAPVPWHETPSWRELADIGVFSLLTDEAGTTEDLAVALEQTAERLVPGPVLSTALAVALLRGEPAAADLVSTLAGGGASAAVALGPGGLTAQPHGDGYRVSGSVALVGAVGVSDLLLCARERDDEVWFLHRADTESRESVDFSRPVGRIALHEAEIPAKAVIPGLSGRRVAELAVTLAAAEASGVADRCLRAAVEHARTREQFGRPIGSFQAVKHLCARMLCRAEQAAALAWDAARAVDEAPDEHPLAAAAAGAVALDAAVDNAKDCVQVLGGIGFTWEHDAHLYLRRALALRQWFGGSARWRRRAAELALAGNRRSLRATDGLPEQRRREIRDAVARIAEAPGPQRRARLAQTGYLVPHWLRPYGLGADAAEQLVIDEELERAGVARPDLFIGAWAVPTILEHGTPEQRDRFTWPTLRGEITWCQLFSEPEAGSDLAALRTRARRVDGGWVLSGQKVWTSLAHEADWAICLARTDDDVPKHKGISYFLVDMTSPGIQVRPLREITGDVRFNEVFLDDVFVPEDCLVGEPGQGWRLARTTLATERVAISGGTALGEEVERLLALARESDEHTERVGSRVAEGLSGSVLRLRSAMRRIHGQNPGAESSVEKLLGVQHRQEVAELAVELLGSDAVEWSDAVHDLLLTRCLSIAGGTTQVLLSVVAERLLGLPRD
ncbi:acyl-CoA dehydrogenase family protein [Saccharopolyspora rosea]|uniref:Acyl-CoA dehydrogenase family protein n=1 Tax=Saccharopolyspora rosea TaxID=524884 RepID=A0ABW3G220_9PSEU|nr:acyl-CoA dehydrogenase family protein [Saccharopolyspora rosea]